MNLLLFASRLIRGRRDNLCGKPSTSIFYKQIYYLFALFSKLFFNLHIFTGIASRAAVHNSLDDCRAYLAFDNFDVRFRRSRKSLAASCAGYEFHFVFFILQDCHRLLTASPSYPSSPKQRIRNKDGRIKQEVLPMLCRQ